MSLSGYCFTATGANSSDQLYSLKRKIEALGGRYLQDLTDEVTHLVAFRVGSEKYHTAVSKDLPVLIPSFIDECQSASYKLDLNKMARNMPPFYGLCFSVTGVPLDDRAETAAMIKQNGGQFSLDFDRTCSHLIVGNEITSTAKISLAEKLSIPLVSIDWVRECIRRFCCLPESYSCITVTPTQLSPYDHVTLEDIKNASPWPPYFKKMFFYVDQHSLEMVKFDILKKLIVYPQGNRFSDFSGHKKLFTHYILHDVSLSTSDLNNLSQYSEEEKMPLVVHEQWILECFHARSTVPVDGFVESEERIRRLIREGHRFLESSSSANSSSLSNIKKVRLLPVDQERKSATDDSSKAPLFSGLTFKLAHFASSDCRAAELIDLIEKNGGSIVESINEKTDYSIAPLILKENKNTNYGEEDDYLNEFWLLHSIKEGKLASSKKGYKTIFTPNFDDSLFSNVRVSLAALSGQYIEYFGKLAKAAGICYSEDLTPQNTHLLLDTPKGPKYDLAQKERIHCVRPAWLRDSIIKGSPQVVKNYSLNDTIVEKENIPAVNEVEDCSMDSLNEKMKNITASPRNESTHHVDFSKDEIDPVNISKNKIIESISDRSDLTDCNEKVKELFKGLTFTCSARFLMDEIQEMERLVEEMGGSFVWTICRDITHYIHKGLYAEENFHNFKKVKKLNKIIVSPWWLRECRKQGIRLNESDYPHTFKMPTDSAVHGTESRNEEPAVASLEVATLPAESLPVNNDIDYESIIEAAKRKELSRKTKIIRDPTAEVKVLTRKRPLEEEEDPPTVKTFLFMGTSSDQRASLTRILKNLGGVVLNVNWDNSVTHVIASSLQASEKFLSACASGIWILAPEYVYHAEKVGSLDCEVEFEINSLKTVPTNESCLLSLPRYWRQERLRGRHPFDGWKCLLSADAVKLSGLKNVLLAGGAQVWTHSDDLSNVLPEDITHFFVSSKKTLQRFPEHFINSCQMAIKGLGYIAEHLCHIHNV